MSRRGYGGPQADCFDERELSQIKRELKENNFAPWMICAPNEKEEPLVINDKRLMMNDYSQAHQATQVLD